ncbi:hypothetical protein [Streptomyces sp. NPDC054975]
MTYGSSVHDPTGSWDADLPLDREVNERLAATVLGWRRGDGTVPPPADIEQAALQLSGYAEFLVRAIRAAMERLPGEQGLPTPAADMHARTGITLAEAIRRLRAPAIRLGDPLKQAQSRARLVDALHSALDRTLAELPAPYRDRKTTTRSRTASPTTLPVPARHRALPGDRPPLSPS